MRKSIILLALLLPIFALSIEKTVVGPETLDLDESLDIKLIITTDEPIYIESITDPVPPHFVATEFPASCSQSESMLSCELGLFVTGGTSISYKLTAIGLGYGIIGGPSLVYGEGIKTAEFFRQYFIGKPKAELSISGPNTLLPGEEITATVVIVNTGIRSLGTAILTLSSVNYSDRLELELAPQELRTINYSLGEAPKSGSQTLSAVLSWANSSTSTTHSYLFVHPSLKASRTVRVEWKLENGSVNGYVSVVYELINNGTAAGTVSLSTGEQLELGPGERQSLAKLYTKAAPAVKISIQDANSNQYEVYSFSEESPEMKKGFFTLLYENVSSDIPAIVLVLVGLVSLYFSTKFKQPGLKAGLIVITLVSGLLLYAQISVGALSLPFFQN
ncbi:MAG: hypothetical protein GOU99_01460 [Candidatus Altiarchaeota archaeon]|nr:hypothetical protein [Candidatus Altiarchaeota archaeon]